MKSKKLFSALAVFLVCLIASSGILAAEPKSEAEAGYGKAELFAMGIGAFTEDYTPNAEMTRAEFAVFISNAAQLLGDTGENWRDEVLADDNKNVSYGDEESIFDDVDQSHPSYSEIMAVYEHGYMRGIADRRFAPDYVVIGREAIKVFVDMLEYTEKADAIGGFPNGYINVAQQIHILKNFDAEYQKPLTQRNAATLLYNALNVPLLSLKTVTDRYSEYGSDKEATFMTEILGLDSVSGRITDNGLTTVEGESKIQESQVKIDGTTLDTSDETESVKNHIGRECKAYYKNEEDNFGELVYYTIEDEKDVVVIDREDFLNAYQRNSVLYISYTEKNSTRTVSLGKNADMIYNNKALLKYNKDLFDFDSGEITLIATEGGEYDVIVVKAYNFLCVDRVDSTDVVYGKGKGTADVFSVVDLSEHDTDYVSLRDEKGQKISASDLVSGHVLNVLISADKKVVVGTVTNKTVDDFTINATERDGDVLTVYGEEDVSYDILNVLDWTNFPSIKNGKVYDLYLNQDGDVVWLEDAAKKSDKLVGIIMAADQMKHGSISDECAVMIYADTGKATTYTLADKFSLNGGKKQEPIDVISTIQAAKGEPVLFTVNEEGLCDSLITAAPYGSTDNERGWYRINPKPRLIKNGKGEYFSETKSWLRDPEDSTWRTEQNWYLYNTAGKDFSAFMYHVPGVTKTFTVPPNESDYTDEKKFSVNKVGFVADTYYAIEGFSTKRNSMEAEVFVLCRSASGGGTVDGGTAFLIENITTGRDIDEETPTRVLKGFLIKGNKTERASLTLAYDATMIDEKEMGSQIEGTAEETEVGPRTVAELKPGDIVGFCTADNGQATAIRILYDYDAGKGAAYSESSELGKTYKARAGVITTYAGYAYALNSEGLRVSRSMPESISSPENVDDITDTVADGEYLVHKLPFWQIRLRQNPSIVVVEKTADGKLKAYSGKAGDIKCYEDTASAGEYDRLVVINEWYGNNFGTVVYKNWN